MGSLEAQVEGYINVSWAKSGNHGNQWLYDEIEIKSSTSFRVIFTSILGQSYTGDSALDDIRVTPGKCSSKKSLSSNSSLIMISCKKRDLTWVEIPSSAIC